MKPWLVVHDRSKSRLAGHYFGVSRELYADQPERTKQHDEIVSEVDTEAEACQEAADLDQLATVQES